MPTSIRVPAPVALAASLLVGVSVGLTGPLGWLIVVGVPLAAYALSRGAAVASAQPTRLFVPAIAASLVIGQLPVMFGYAQGARLVSAAVLALAATVALLRPARLRTAGWPRVIVSMYLAVLVAMLVRGGLSGANGSVPAAVLDVVQYLSAFALVYGVARASETPNDLSRVFQAVAVAPAVYVGTNLVLLAASAGGLPIPMAKQTSVSLDSQATTLAGIGVHIDRVQLPLAASVNNVGVVAAAGVAAGVVLALRGGRPLIGGIATSVCMAGLLLTDTRTALVIAVVVALLALAWPVGRWALLVAVAVPVSPLLLVWLVDRLNGVVGGVLSSGGRDFATGSNRFIIWDRALDTAQHPAATSTLSTLERVVFGYGAGGQVASGAAYRYEFLFRSQEYRLAHTHNLAIQTVLDGGLVALVVFTVAACVAAVRLANIARTSIAGSASAVLAMTAVLLGAGATEVVPTYIAPESLFLFVMALALAVLRPRTDWLSPLPASLAKRPQRPGDLCRSSGALEGIRHLSNVRYVVVR